MRRPRCLACRALLHCSGRDNHWVINGRKKFITGAEGARVGIMVLFGCEFLDVAKEGELIKCDGEMTRIGGSLIFLRGILRSGDRKLFSFSGTIKRVKKKAEVEA